VIYTCKVFRNKVWVDTACNKVEDGDLFRMYRNGILIETEGKTETIMKSMVRK